MVYSKLPQIRVQLFGYIFSPSWLMTFITFMLLPCLITLGTWQLHRAAEKRQIEHDFANQSSPLNLQEATKLSKEHLRYRRLAIEGYFDNAHTFFLDNQMHNHQTGIHVVTPFLTTGNHTSLLIDRGFIPILNRERLPQINSVTGKRTITGLIYWPAKRFILKQEDLTDHWPLLLQSIDVPRIAAKLQKPIFSYYLLLETGDDSHYIHDWHPVNFPSYRHTGYAVQWFALSVLLIILYISLNLTKFNE